VCGGSDYIQLAKGGNHCAEFDSSVYSTISYIPLLHMYYNSSLIRYVGIIKAIQVICLG